MRKGTLIAQFLGISNFWLFSNCDISTGIYGSDIALGKRQLITSNECCPTLEV